MIIGPDDTPYSCGFYFLDVIFSKDHPHKPPKVSFETRSGQIRFHPNLYANSKVCLSILGTWSGPGWTSAQTLSSVLLTIQSLLIKDPLTNEPGFTKQTPHTKKRHVDYETMVTFENYRIAILKMLQDPPNGFEAFLPIMNQCFIANAEKIHNKLVELHKIEPKVINMRCSVYSQFESVIDYNTCLIQFESLRQQIVPKPSSINQIQQLEETNSQNTSENTIEVLDNQLQTCTVSTSQLKKHIKKPKRKANELDMQGTTLSIEQGDGKTMIQFQSRKCKQKDVTQPPKWQWRKINNQG